VYRIDRRHTPGTLKPRLPPRQSQGISYVASGLWAEANWAGHAPTNPGLQFSHLAQFRRNEDRGKALSREAGATVSERL